MTGNIFFFFELDQCMVSFLDGSPLMLNMIEQICVKKAQLTLHLLVPGKSKQKNK